MQAFPEGIALDSTYLAPAALEQAAAAAEEALAAGGWCDLAAHLPSALSAHDVAAALGRVRAVSAAVAAGRAVVLAGSCVVAAPLLEGLKAQLLQEARAAAEAAHLQQKAAAKKVAAAPAATADWTMGGGGRKGSGGAAAPAAAESDDDDDWDTGRGKKSKGKKGGKGKGGGGGGGRGAGGGKGGAVPAGKPGKGGGGGGGQVPAAGAPAAQVQLSQDALAGLVASLRPELEGAGEGGELAAAVAAVLRPSVLAEYDSALAAIFTAGAERRRRLREAAAAALDEAHTRLCVLARGAELFEGDEATAGVLARHLLRTAAADCVDAVLRYLAADEAAAGEGGEEEGGEGLGEAAAGPLPPAQRAAILKRLAPDVKGPTTVAVDKLSGSSSQVWTGWEVRCAFVCACVCALISWGRGDAPTTAAALAARRLSASKQPTISPALQEFMVELGAAAEAAGLRLRRPDKKAERAWVAAHRAALAAQAAAAADPSGVLAAAVPALLARATARAVSLPGRALAAAVEKLREHLPEEAHALLVDFHAAVVESLRSSAGEGSGGGGEAAGVLAARLAEMQPRVQALLEVSGGDGAEA